MSIAITIGIMFLLFGFILFMREDFPIDNIFEELHPRSYLFIGITVLINCLVYYLIHK